MLPGGAVDAADEASSGDFFGEQAFPLVRPRDLVSFADKSEIREPCLDEMVSGETDDRRIVVQYPSDRLEFAGDVVDDEKRRPVAAHKRGEVRRDPICDDACGVPSRFVECRGFPCAARADVKRPWRVQLREAQDPVKDA